MIPVTVDFSNPGQTHIRLVEAGDEGRGNGNKHVFSRGRDECPEVRLQLLNNLEHLSSTVWEPGVGQASDLSLDRM